MLAKAFILVLSVSLHVLAQDNKSSRTGSNYPDQVGDIYFDPKYDDPNFSVCNEKNIKQDYAVNTGFRGERRALIDYFMNKYQYQDDYTTTSGYVTLRFIINCKGETGRFRVYQLDKNFEKIDFHPGLISQLLNLSKKAQGWIPGIFQNANCDSYDHIVFKIENGKLIELTF